MSTEETPEHETVNRESHPNAGGPEGLAGDMGVSSERTGGFEGVEGTGTAASAQGRTDGESPSGPPAAREYEDREDEVPDKPDQTSPVTNVDRTVGEVQPDEVEHKHPFDPDRNPGH
ncbi:hypothetical protein BH10ACT10_BH10ACT10_10670 [soil metagenome]